MSKDKSDKINHPVHYRGYGNIECIDAIEAMGMGYEFCIGNAVKYLWRAGLKGDIVEDLAKAEWYVARAKKYVEAERKKLEVAEVGGGDGGEENDHEDD